MRVLRGVALLAIERRSVLFGKIFDENGTARPVRMQVIGKDEDAFTAELADGVVEARGSRIGLDGLGFFQVLAIVRTETAHGGRTYLRLGPLPVVTA